MAEIAELGFVVDATGIERGVQKGNSALDALERKIQRVVQTFNEANKATSQGLGFAGNQSRQSATEQAEARHQARLAEITARSATREREFQLRRELETQRHQQRLTEIEAREAVKRSGQRGGEITSLRQFMRRYASTIREAGESIQQAGISLVALSAGMITFGRRAVSAATDIDSQVNVLKALSGSAALAEQRYKQLIATSQKTPGLTSALATTLDAQLRVAGATVQTVDKILPAIGRLNAVQKLQDPQRFVQNLVQLVTGQFQVRDLRELVQNSPLAGQLITQLFNVDSPLNAQAIRESAQKLGVTSIDTFFTAFAAAAARNQNLQNVTESLGTRFEKLSDRISIALRPLGLVIVNALLPLVDKLVPFIERMATAFDRLSPSVKSAILVLSGLVIAVGPLVFALGGLIQTVGALGNLFTVFGAGGALTTLGASFGGLSVALGLVTVAVGALALAWYNNFGGIRDFTSEAVSDLKRGLGEIRDFLKSMASEVGGTKALLAGVSDYYQFWSENTRQTFRFAFDSIGPLIRGIFESMGATIRGFLKLIQGDIVGAIKSWGDSIAAQMRAIEGIFEAGFNGILRGVGRFADVLRSLSPEYYDIGVTWAKSLFKGFIGALPSQIGEKALSFARGARDIAKGRELALPQAPDLVPGLPANLQELLGNNKKTPPPNPKGNKADLTGDKAETEAARLARAQSEYKKTLAEQDVRVEKAALDRIQKDVEEFYAQGKISTKDYYDSKLAIAEQGIKLELDAIGKQIEAEEKLLSQAKKGSEKQKIETDLLKLRTDLLLKTRELTDAEIENLRQFKKALGDFKFDPSQQETLKGEFVTPIQQRARDTLKQLAEASTAHDRLRGNLNEDELRIQNQIESGVLDEVEGRKALLAVQRDYRDQLISTLEARRQLAAIEGDQTAIARLNAEIESLRNLGLELNNTQRFLKGLGPGTDTGRLFEDFGSGLRNAIHTGFRDGFGAARKSFLDLLKDLAADLLTSTLVQIIRNLFNPRGQQGAQGIAGGLLGGATGGGGGGGIGGFIGSLFGGGGNSGGGNFLTGGFAGGNPAGNILGGGGNSGGGGLVGGLLNRFLGGGGNRVQNIGGLPFADLGTKELLKQSAGGGTGGIGGLVGKLNLGGLGASGLLLGGGLLGSLAGGKSQIGQLLGGVGGTLLGGALGASGIFGSGIAGALPALFSNPFTAIIGGALIGGALLFKFFGNRDLKDYRKHILNEYALDVKSDKVLEQIREIGKQNFGKEYKNKRIETIRLADVRELLVNYAERTGQKGNSKLFSAAALQDPFSEQNRFIRRAMGGPVSAFQPTIVGDGGRPEVFMPQSPGLIFPSVQSFASAVGGGGTGLNGRALAGILVRVAEALDRFESMPPGEVVRTALSTSPDIATEAVAQSFRRRSEASTSIRDNVFQR